MITPLGEGFKPDVPNFKNHDAALSQPFRSNLIYLGQMGTILPKTEKEEIIRALINQIPHFKGSIEELTRLIGVLGDKDLEARLLETYKTVRATDMWPDINKPLRSWVEGDLRVKMAQQEDLATARIRPTSSKSKLTIVHANMTEKKAEQLLGKEQIGKWLVWADSNGKHVYSRKNSEGKIDHYRAASKGSLDELVSVYNIDLVIPPQGQT